MGWQPSLLEVGSPGVDRGFATIHRHELADGAWVDHQPAWLTGADTLFERLVHELPWRTRPVAMDGERLVEPRLTWWWRRDDADAPPLPGVVVEALRVLSARYERDFDSVGCNLYRGGADSVGWHAEREGRTGPEPVVAMVSLGEARPFLLRPAGGGASRAFRLGHGDLLVMGGSCQRTWQHRVPKVRAAGPRMSLTFRHGVEPPPGDAA